MKESNHVTVVGAGLAGSEAAWQLANRGVSVTLVEMRGVVQTPAHRSFDFAELVCSNSLRSNALTNAVGLLKEEMRRLGSLIMQCADQHAVPAGGALAVDREAFSREITLRLSNHPNICVKREVVDEIPEGVTILATGPLTGERLSESIAAFTGQSSLYFYDAAAPIVEHASIDMTKAFIASRYGKGEAAYINCPMDEETFNRFYDALVSAETAELHTFEKEIYFEGCMPVEVMAKRGRQTLLFGPLKPVGLAHPETGKEAFAVVQLRQDNAAATLYNMVGFQTHLKWGEQKRVFQMIPGLESAEFVRYGVMHRNTFLRSPLVLKETYQSIERPSLFFAGQITGVEGYVESAASGLVAGINAAKYVGSQEPIIFPRETVIGSLAHYITHADPDHFQPMNATFGLLPPLEQRVRSKIEKNEKLSLRSIDIVQNLVDKDVNSLASRF